jgi:hypothetical protein
MRPYGLWNMHANICNRGVHGIVVRCKFEDVLTSISLIVCMTI